ncbi:hypothetical protein JTB14_004237 [Gonioctena quinquepunctata]|nr:hypothetical protein JTB14_004237 [Gonioctena quinquepunctata]
MLRKVEMAEIVSERPVASLTLLLGTQEHLRHLGLLMKYKRPFNIFHNRDVWETLESEDDIFENGLVTGDHEISSVDEVKANDKENEMDADHEANDEVLNSERSEEKFKEGSWVIAEYGNASYVGEVVDIKGNKAETMFLQKN